MYLTPTSSGDDLSNRFSEEHFFSGSILTGSIFFGEHFSLGSIFFCGAFCFVEHFLESIFWGAFGREHFFGKHLDLHRIIYLQDTWGFNEIIGIIPLFLHQMALTTWKYLSLWEQKNSMLIISFGPKYFRLSLQIYQCAISQM